MASPEEVLCSRESGFICLFSLRYVKKFINTCYMTMLIHDNISRGKESVETPKAPPRAGEKFWTMPFYYHMINQLQTR